MSSRRLIVGLGNPGERYDGTRHNIGFAVLDRLAVRCDAEWKDKAAWSGHVALVGSSAVLLKPSTFMNESGRAVAAVANFYKLAGRDVVLVYDDRDLPFGEVRWTDGIRTGAHHNGVRSVAKDFGRDVVRLRFGIGSDIMRHRPLDEFVLDRFSGGERDSLAALIEGACDELVRHLGLPEASA